MHWDIPVPLLVSVVLGHVMEVIPSHYNCPLHFGGDDYSLEDLASDGNIGGEWALFIDVLGLNGFLGSLETQPDVLKVSDA